MRNGVSAIVRLVVLPMGSYLVKLKALASLLAFVGASAFASTTSVSGAALENDLANSSYTFALGSGTWDLIGDTESTNISWTGVTLFRLGPVSNVGFDSNPDDGFSFTGLTSGSYKLAFSGLAGAPFGYFGGSFSVAAAPVPEPETYAMMLAGLGAIGFMARRRQSK